MRSLILLMHVSLDGFTAGPNGEMDWIRFDDELIDDVTELTASADTALYGRVTYQMMEGYWPTAADSPTASQHDIDHGRWVNQSLKLVFSRTLERADWQNTQIVRDDIPAELARIKQRPGKNLLMIGSPSTARTFTRLGLIDEYWINVNPVVLGSGIPLFASSADRVDLQLVSSKLYASGVVGLRYRRAPTE